MSDVRKINLRGGSIDNISAVSRESYKMSDTNAELFKGVLEKLSRLSFWDPYYQAWIPFVQTYLRSGADPKAASVWLPILGAKDKVMLPKTGAHTRAFRELQRMRRSTNTEAFADFYWGEIESFYQYSVFVLDSAKQIKKIVQDPQVIQDLCQNLLKCSDSVIGVSDFLGDACFLYRHVPEEIRIELGREKVLIEKQVDAYCEQFSKTFDDVCSFCSGKSEIYMWYCAEVKDLIIRAWQDATNPVRNYSRLTPADVLKMPINISEKVTAYIGDLPCVTDLDVNMEFVFDALQSALKENASYDDGTSFYAYTIPVSYYTRLFGILNEFSYSITDGSFFYGLLSYAMAAAWKQGSNTENVRSRYILSLQERGFPVKED